MSVLLVDDHEVVRRGLRDLLDTEDDVSIVAEAGAVADVEDESTKAERYRRLKARRRNGDSNGNGDKPHET